MRRYKVVSLKYSTFVTVEATDEDQARMKASMSSPAFEDPDCLVETGDPVYLMAYDELEAPSAINCSGVEKANDGIDFA